MIIKYTFEDGTILRLLDFGLSCEEIWKLEELHGKCKANMVTTRKKERGIMKNKNGEE